MAKKKKTMKPAGRPIKDVPPKAPPSGAKPPASNGEEGGGQRFVLIPASLFNQLLEANTQHVELATQANIQLKNLARSQAREQQPNVPPPQPGRPRKRKAAEK